VNDLSFVMRVVDTLEDARLRVWVYGGWAEELRGLRAPVEHEDVDLLYPARDLGRVDAFLRSRRLAATVELPHKRSFELEGVPVEILLVQKDERGWFSDLPAGPHRWPADVFATAGSLPVASAEALEGYRRRRRRQARAA
jgi:hypothetical protein